ncbi:WW domain protein [Rhizoctonia solani AG-3 Rhs1AP]|uniref:WW domain protein n=1 Tax=Rhizoctonia solani AG-3 Rhs1AP TaxID=1086054 RepID=X8JET5_9AGAM|nr:WW domain protein [Rhizoctonia solani AG-3 Rhs1AP]
MAASPKDQPSPQPDTPEKADATKRVEDEQAGTAEEEENPKDTEKESKSESEAKEEQGDDANPPLPDEPLPPQNEWQAVWSPAHNAYYFFNSRTSETTWVNPLDPSASTPAVQPTQEQSQNQRRVKPHLRISRTWAVSIPNLPISIQHSLFPRLAQKALFPRFRRDSALATDGSRPWMGGDRSI